MIITIKLTNDNIEEVDVIRLFKDFNSRIFMLSNAFGSFMLMELIAFNNLVIIREVDPTDAEIWINANDDDVLSSDDITFNPLNINESEKILTYVEYLIIYAQHEKFWTLNNKKINDLNFPMPAPDQDTNDKSNKVIKIMFKAADPTGNRTLNDFLDRIIKVGYNNLTLIERKKLDELSSN